MPTLTVFKCPDGFHFGMYILLEITENGNLEYYPIKKLPARLFVTREDAIKSINEPYQLMESVLMKV